MDPTEFDEFDALLHDERWDSAFQVGWRVLHRLMRSFYANLILCNPTPTSGDPITGIRDLIQKIDRAGEDDLFQKWAPKLTQIDVCGEIERRSPGLWSRYSSAKQLRHFIFHGRLFLEDGFDVKACAQALREMVGITDQLFGDNAHYAHVRRGGPLPPTVDYSYDAENERVTISLDPDFGEPVIRR